MGDSRKWWGLCLWLLGNGDNLRSGGHALVGDDDQHVPAGRNSSARGGQHAELSAGARAALAVLPVMGGAGMWSKRWPRVAPGAGTHMPGGRMLRFPGIATLSVPPPGATTLEAMLSHRARASAAGGTHGAGRSWSSCQAGHQQRWTPAGSPPARQARECGIHPRISCTMAYRSGVTAAQRPCAS